jgi:hypothetical protein
VMIVMAYARQTVRYMEYDKKYFRVHRLQAFGRDIVTSNHEH